MKYLWSIFLILNLCFLGLAIRYLGVERVSFSESLILRGLSCLLVAVIYSFYKRERLFPLKVKIQLYRGMLSGLALALFSLSYNMLPASIVSSLSLIDVPLLILFSFMVGETYSTRSKLLSIGSIFIFLVLVLSINKTAYPIQGIFFLITGTILLAFGYLLIKKSLETESLSATVFTPAVSILLYGFVIKLIYPQASDAVIGWSGFSILIALLSGILMFYSYLATAKLYSLLPVAQAEFPTLMSAIFLFPLEYLILNENFSENDIFLNFGFVLVIYFLVGAQKVEQAPPSQFQNPKFPLIAQAFDYTCGVACVRSLRKYLNFADVSELDLATQLGTIELGFTPPEAIVKYLNSIGLTVSLMRNAKAEDLAIQNSSGKIIIITWWDEDAGHYSLVENLSETKIVLMDPWLARDGHYNILSLRDFILLWQQRGSVILSIEPRHA